MATGGVAAAVLIVAGITLLAPSRTPVIPGLPEPASAIGSTPLGPDVPVVPLAGPPRHRRAVAHVRAAPQGRILAVGDSVMLGASGALRSAIGPRLVVDAVVGRQFVEGVAAIAAHLGEARTGVVIVHLGNNGYIPFTDLKGMLDRLRGVPRVVLVTTRVDKPWQDSVNDALKWARGYRRNVALADWNAVSAGHPEWFADGTHANATGARQYAALVARKIRRGRG